MMGLSRPDWLALTPKQYELFRESWHKRAAASERQTWEIARWQVFKTLCPPTKKQISITDLIRFPWEKKEAPARCGNTGGDAPATLSGKERFNKLKERWK